MYQCEEGGGGYQHQITYKGSDSSYSNGRYSMVCTKLNLELGDLPDVLSVVPIDFTCHVDNVGLCTYVREGQDCIINSRSCGSLIDCLTSYNSDYDRLNLSFQTRRRTLAKQYQFYSTSSNISCLQDRDCYRNILQLGIEVETEMQDAGSAEYFSNILQDINATHAKCLSPNSCDKKSSDYLDCLMGCLGLDERKCFTIEQNLRERLGCASHGFQTFGYCDQRYFNFEYEDDCIAPGVWAEHCSTENIRDTVKDCLLSVKNCSEINDCL